MNRNQNKIPVGVFRDILIGSSKSIRSIATPDSVYKNNEEGDHLEAGFEFLSFDA